MNLLPFNEGEITPIIPSLSYSQDVILKGILTLYVPAGRFEIDATYNKGSFYRNKSIPHPLYKYDIYPKIEGVEKYDCRNLPHAFDSVESMIIDLPFLTNVGDDLELQKRYSGFKTRKKLYSLYKESIKEAYRILKPNGILVFKCQDGMNGRYFDLISIDAVLLPAREIGFFEIDLFILASKARPMRSKIQKHSRKYHSYFWVFKKGKKC